MTERKISDGDPALSEGVEGGGGAVEQAGAVVRVIDRERQKELDGRLWEDLEFRRACVEYQGLTLAETSVRSDLNIVAGVGEWGDYYSNEGESSQLMQVIEGHVEEEEEEWGVTMPGGAKGAKSKIDTGFPGSRWSRKPNMLAENLVVTRREVVVATQVAMVEAALQQAAADQGLESVQEFDDIVISVTAPSTLLLGEYVSTALSLKPGVKIKLVSAACNSMGAGLEEQIRRTQDDSELRGKNAVVVGLETMMMFRGYIDEDLQGSVNWEALNFFSDSMGWVAYTIGDLEWVMGVRNERRDGIGLCALNTAGVCGLPLPGGWGLSGEGPSLMWESENTLIVELTSPQAWKLDDGRVFQPVMEMNLRETTEHFATVAALLVEAFREQWERLAGEKKLPDDLTWENIVSFWMHRPSRKLQEMMAEAVFAMTRRMSYRDFHKRYMKVGNTLRGMLVGMVGEGKRVTATIMAELAGKKGMGIAELGQKLTAEDKMMRAWKKFRDKKVPWDGSRGNAPCAIVGHEAVAKLKQLRRGKYLAVFVFGAGSSGEFGLIRLRDRKKKAVAA